MLAGEIGLFSNKMFNWAVGGSLMGQMTVVYVPFVQRIFQTEALGFMDLIVLVAVASCVFWVDEGRKFLVRRKGGGGRGALRGYSASV